MAQEVFDIERGSSQEIALDTLHIHKFSKLTISGTVIRGRSDGPRVLLIAGIHGDELNGVAIVRRLTRFCQEEDIAGTVLAIPVVNVWGVLSHTRYMIDGRDLNRSFPGHHKGSYASRVADSVFRIARSCDYVVDFHSASGGRSNLPQVRADMDDSDMARLAKAFGATYIYNHRGVEGTLRRELGDRGVPAILYEGGEQGTFERAAVEVGVRGGLNVMSHVDVLDRDLVEPPFRLVLDKAKWIRSSVGGIVERKVEAGSYVSPCTTVAEITDIFGERSEDITFDKEGVVIGVTHRPIVTPGAPIAHILELEGMEEETAELFRRGDAGLSLDGLS